MCSSTQQSHSQPVTSINDSQSDGEKHSKGMNKEKKGKWNCGSFVWGTMFGIAVLMIFDTLRPYFPHLNRDSVAISEEVCQTEKCKVTANSFLWAMNDSADPCEDFYQFACGNWILNKSKTENASFISQYKIIEKGIEMQLLESVEAIDGNDAESMQQLKILYDSCIEFDTETTLADQFQSFADKFPNTSKLHSKDRPVVCIRAVDLIMPVASAHRYITKFIPAGTETEASELVPFIISAFQKLITDLEWMDRSTKLRVIGKSNIILNLIGYPESLLDSGFVDNYYKGLNFTSTNGSSFMHNVHTMFREWSETKGNPKVWGSVPVATGNAFYYKDINTLHIPVANLLEPVFGNGLRAVDFGALGYVVGHELSHGFDNTAISLNMPDQYETTFWSPTAKETFNSKLKCVVDQYGNYSLPKQGDEQANDKKINGSKTLTENIADISGIQVAFEAYKLYINERKESEPRLPGMEKYSPEQLFFLSFANSRCTYQRPDELLQTIEADNHSPSKYRVIGGLSNSREFSEVWNCPVSSRMNPEHKCTVWE